VLSDPVKGRAAMSVRSSMPDSGPPGSTPIAVAVAKDELAAALDTFIEGAAHLRTAIQALDDYEALGKGVRQHLPDRGALYRADADQSVERRSRLDRCKTIVQNER
jgi:hypothetical protein